MKTPEGNVLGKFKDPLKVHCGWRTVKEEAVIRGEAKEVACDLAVGPFSLVISPLSVNIRELMHL